jgi:hypothetical protein
VPPWSSATDPPQLASVAAPAAKIATQIAIRLAVGLSPPDLITPGVGVVRSAVAHTYRREERPWPRQCLDVRWIGTRDLTDFMAARRTILPDQVARSLDVAD